MYVLPIKNDKKEVHFVKKLNNLLQFEDVGLVYQSKQGETEALKNLNFGIKQGEFVAIVGPSGCGKTTILSIVSGILKATSGKVLINGEDIANNKNYIGYMFQRDHLFEWRTIWQNIMLGLELKKGITAEQKQYATNLIEKYGLKDFINKKPRELSGGMRQRVALIRTLVLNPEILLLDEPFSALDFQTRLNVCDDVAGIIKNENKTAILVTHDISEAISMADKILVLTQRPACIKKVFEVNLKGDTPLQRRENAEFSKIFNDVWRELQYE